MSTILILACVVWGVFIVWRSWDDCDWGNW